MSDNHDWTRKCRIAIFVPSLNGGGTERVMVSLANEFSTRGYDVDLVLAKAQGPYLMDVSSNVHVIDLKAGRIIKALIPLVRYLKRKKPTAMLAAMTHTNIVAILACMVGRVSTRLVVSERSTISARVERSRDIVARFIYYLVPKLYSRADGIVAVSQASLEDLIRFTGLPAKTIEFIYNPFEIGRIEVRAHETLDHPWFESGQPPVILAVGRFNEAKDYPNLIHAFAKVRRNLSVRLLLLGEGELRGMLESLLLEYGLTNDDVQMPGFVTNPFAYLSRCSVFVLSSRYEGLPGALIEAMACGAPVVSTDCPSGPREILEGGCWGKLVPVGDVEALAQAIDAVLTMPRYLLPNVRERAADFDKDKAVDAYLKVLGLPPEWVRH